MIDRKKVILYTCCMSLFVVTMDVTVVNVALPSIQSDFHTNLSTLQWVTDGYTLMVASLLLLSGSTADRIGRKRVLQLGLACFGLASFLCGISQTGAIDRVSHVARDWWFYVKSGSNVYYYTGIYRKVRKSESNWLVGLCYRDFLRHGPDYWRTNCFLF